MLKPSTNKSFRIEVQRWLKAMASEMMKVMKKQNKEQLQLLSNEVVSRKDAKLS